MAMSLITGSLGWAPQTAKGTAATGAYYWHKIGRMAVDVPEVADVLPQEIGGAMLPNAAFKAGYWSEGAVDLAPRVDEHIGWLFFSLAGAAAVSGAGPYRHTFSRPTSDAPPEKWLTFRRLLPQSDGTFFGETLQDCKVLTFSLMADAASLLAGRFGFRGLGCEPNYNASGTGWAPSTDQGGYELASGIPLTTVAGITINSDGALTKVTSAALNFTNNAPDPRTEMVIGSYVPHHVTVLSRSITINLTIFWENSGWYKKIKNGDGSAWSPVPYQPTTDFTMYFQTPGNLSGLGYPGKIGFWAPSGGIFWQMRGIDARGGNIAVVELLGTVLDVPTNNEPWRLWLENSRSTAYSV